MREGAIPPASHIWDQGSAGHDRSHCTESVFVLSIMYIPVVFLHKILLFLYPPFSLRRMCPYGTIYTEKDEEVLHHDWLSLFCDPHCDALWFRPSVSLYAPAGFLFYINRKTVDIIQIMRFWSLYPAAEEMPDYRRTYLPRICSCMYGDFHKSPFFVISRQMTV